MCKFWCDDLKMCRLPAVHRRIHQSKTWLTSSLRYIRILLIKITTGTTFKVQPKQKNQDNNPIFDSIEELNRTREDNTGEQARWIWIGWSEVWVCVDQIQLIYFIVLWLVARDQMSSASVDRLFSVLKLVGEAIDQAILEETLEYNMVHHGIYQPPAS